MDALNAWTGAARAWIEGIPDLALAAGAGLVVWACVHLLTGASLRLLARIAGRTTTTLDDELLARLRLPLRYVGPVAGIHAGAAVYGAPWIVGAAEIVEGLLLTYAIVATVEILVVERWLEGRQGVQVPPLVRQVVITVVYGCVLLGVAGEVFGIDITPLLATGSVTTVIVGLALQQPLSNLFSGLVLHLERHPSPGDWLLVDGREACVQQIGWRSTRLRMFTDDVLVVPNATLVNAQLINYSEPSRVCGRNIPVPVPLDVPPHLFDELVRESLRQVEGVVWEPAPKTWLVAVDDHCQRYVVRFWLHDFRWHDDIESNFLKRLWYRFHEAGIAFPTPHQAIRMVEGRPPPAFAGLEPVRTRDLAAPDAVNAPRVPPVPAAPTGPAASDATSAPPPSPPTPEGHSG